MENQGQLITPETPEKPAVSTVYKTQINARTNGFTPHENSLWPNISLSDITKERRGRIWGMLDDFCRFQWRGYDAFESFGAFIVNEQKGSLKFYNGPNYSNEYTKSQFSSYASNLTGIKFDQQKISFKIAVYWISAKDYRIFMDYLDAYAIDYLSFAWDYDWSYLVKLTGCKDTTKHVVGYEGNEPMYYTEMDLNFEVQGPACARTTLPLSTKVKDNTIIIEFKSLNDINKMENEEDKKKINKDSLKTEMMTPLRYDISFPKKQTGDVSLSLKFGSDVLFDVVLTNLPTTASEEDTIQLLYDSETGLLFLKKGSQPQLLSLVTTASEGSKIVSSMEVNKYYIQPWEDLYSFTWNFKIGNTSISPESQNLIIYGRRRIA